MTRPASRLSRISSHGSARRGAGSAGAGILVLIALAGGTARAQSEADKKRAQTLQTDGVHLLERGDNRGALRKFEEAIRVFPSPKIRFNMGRAHVALGNEVEALDDFERFLDEAPYAPKQSRDEAQRIVDSLRPKMSYLDIVTDDSGARVLVDGKEVGVAPLDRPLPTTPGAHQVRLEKAAMLAETRDVTPVPGQKIRVLLKMRPVVVAAPDSAPPPTATAVAPPRPRADEQQEEQEQAPRRARARTTISGRDRDESGARPPEPIREVPEAPPPAPAGSGTGRRALKWVSWGLAVGGAALGTYGFLTNGSGVSEFNQWCAFVSGSATPDPNVPNNTHTVQSCVDLRNRYESATKLAVAGFVGAGVFTALGLVFWATETNAPPGSAARETAWACVPSVGAGAQASVTCAWRF